MKHNLVKPTTRASQSPAELVGEMVRVRPYYHIPAGPSGFESVRAQFTYWGEVISQYGSEMVVVKHNNPTGPWQREAAYRPSELHTNRCVCPACKGGRGINEMHGA